MEVKISSEFSREFSFDDSLIVIDLTKNMKDYFSDKNYGGNINIIFIGLICISKGFEPFFKVRPPKILKKISAFEYESKLDFEEFFNADNDHKKQIIIKEILSITKEVFLVKKVPSFDSATFIHDLETFLITNNQI